jgi:hypothetical protein
MAKRAAKPTRVKRAAEKVKRPAKPRAKRATNMVMTTKDSAAALVAGAMTSPQGERMKARVKRPVYISGKECKQGETVDVSPSVYAELRTSGYLEADEKPEPAPAKSKPKDAD